MIEKQQKIIVTFKTTLDAMAMEEICMEKKIEGRLIPLPKKIAASCGMAFCADVSKESEILLLLKEEDVSFQGIYYEWI